MSEFRIFLDDAVDTYKKSTAEDSAVKESESGISLRDIIDGDIIAEDMLEDIADLPSPLSTPPPHSKLSRKINHGEEPALSAYEIAIKSGFEGDEQEWLKSLKGDTGWGGSGTDGQNGKDGDRGFRGFAGEAGEAGEDGTNGTNGTDGVDGTSGTNGASSLGDFQRTVETNDEFKVGYNKDTTDATIVSIYKEVPGVEETLSNVFNAAASTASDFEYDDTKLDFLNGNLRLKSVSSTTYSIASANYTGNNFSFFTEDDSPSCISFSADGTKMFMGANDGNQSRIYQYTLTEGYDITTASYDNVFFNVSVAMGTYEVAEAIRFDPDGTTMFVLGSRYDAVHQYSLSVGFDLSTASSDNITFALNGQGTYMTDIDFNNDGTKMFSVGYSSKQVHEYPLTTPWDLSTASFNVSVAYSEDTPTVQSIAFNNDGTKMFTICSFSDSVSQYSLSIGFDITTMIYDNVTFNTLAEDGDPRDIQFNIDGSKMFVVGIGTDSVYEYTTGQSLYTTNEFIPAITSNPLDTQYWTSIESITATDIDEGQSVLYSYSTDLRESWLINKGSELARTIARNNAGTWEYNSNITYESETWVVASINDDSTALSEAMSVSVNQMSSDFGYVNTTTKPAYSDLLDNLSQAIILYTADQTITPKYDNTVIVYDALSMYTLLSPVTDYDVELGNNEAIITSKVSGNIKGRIL